MWVYYFTEYVRMGVIFNVKILQVSLLVSRPPPRRMWSWFRLCDTEKFCIKVDCCGRIGQHDGAAPAAPLFVTVDAAIGRRRILTKDTPSFTPCWNETALQNDLYERVPQSFEKQFPFRFS